MEEQLPPQQEPTSEYDTTQEQGQLEAIQKELQDIEASVENDFAEHISALIDNDSVLEELFFSDRVTFFKKIIEEQNKFVSALVEPRVAKAKELQDTIAGKSELANIEAIKQDFQSRHPEVDIKELIAFFANELPPRVQEEIKSQPIEAFFDLVYEIYAAQNAPQEEAPPEESPPEDLPAQAQGVAVDSQQSDTNSGALPMNRQ
ncbi:hypothetical protein LS77_010575 [Helicobacter bilis]|uniref:Coiled-coil domain-containing protein n=2 Tax=Helicobacter bilis TaxID=37372 RepID=A0A6D2C951_9HELI|nr:hypothetical protein [Helicobacter bilis]EMZ41462.1 hypothetical protein C826_00482 [Helicobacter bilis WiWa]TLE02423.1 hypothetical protein LS77_010575 [Helicobacter bilis]TLE04104.1 hypothetical protein LS76_009220 [Helicobacter bilis]